MVTTRFSRRTKTYVVGRSLVSRLSDDNLKENVLALCKHIASSRPIVGACFYGSRVCGYGDEKSPVNVLLILSSYPRLLNAYTKPLDAVNAFILAVDQRAFERDVERGWLGEFAAEKIMVPYQPLINEEYLQRQEVKAKKRISSELLENIVLEFPESSHELLIGAEYFMYEAMMRRARLFPLIIYSCLNMMRRDLRGKNVNAMMAGYREALNQLAEENRITFSNGYVKITRSYIDAAKSRKPRLPVFLRALQRVVFLHVLSILPKIMDSLVQDQRIFIRSHKSVKVEDLVFQLEDPKSFLFVPTRLGLVAFSENATIEDFVRKIFPGGEALEVKIEEIGGVLNDVYLLRLRRNRAEERVVVKKFRDWSGFKWFALALWAVGTKSFAVLGRSRLEREFAINKFLKSQGLPVPNVIYVSPRERLIFKDFIEGEKMVEIIKRIISSKERAIREVALVKEVGRKIAAVHRLGVALGDCKPENIVVTKDGEPFFVDLEQASRGGDQAWDVAEFLYYSAHYVSPISSANAAEIMTESFVEGYLEAGGKGETVRKARSARYVKVFSVFTPPHVILAVSNVCKKMGKDG